MVYLCLLAYTIFRDGTLVSTVLTAVWGAVFSAMKRVEAVELHVSLGLLPLHNNISCYTILYHIVPYYIILYHVDIILFHVVSYQVPGRK